MSGEDIAKVIKNCVQRRRIIRAQITVFSNFLTQQQDNPDYDRIQARLETITDCFQEFKDVQKTLEQEEPDKNHHEKRIETEESYHDGVATARSLLRKAAAVAGITGNSERSTPAPINPPSDATAFSPRIATRKLPDLNPPAFDGQIEAWASFKSRFLSMVDKNDNLTASDKFEYLQSALLGKAARIIESLETTESSYQDAWELLTAKYDNDRKAILRHWSILRDYPVLQKDTAEALDDLVVTFRQQLRSLRNLGQVVSGWDTCLISLLLSKIGKGTAYQWELTLTDNKMPPYTSLLEFLDKRANCSDTRGPETHNKDPKQSSKQDNRKKGNNNFRNGQRQTYLASATAGTSSNQPMECTLCKEAHAPSYCPKLKDISAEERIKLVRDAGLCLNCFRSNHKTKACRYGRRCKICSRLHHTLLHLDLPEGSTQSEA